MSINDIVNVNITAQTTAIEEPNFGIPMVLGTHKAWTDLARVYSNLNGVSEDFGPYTPEYISAQAIFGQNEAPANMWIGRRNADVATLRVVTGLFNQLYNVDINGTNIQVNSAGISQISTITWSGAFTTGSPVQLINVVVNNTILGTITSYLNFSSDFLAGQTVYPIVNGVSLTPIPFDTDQATTIGDLATEIAAADGVTSATASGTQIIVVFTNPGANTVNSCITLGPGTVPTCTIREGGFQFNTNQATTIGDIATAIAALPTVFSAVAVTNTITVTSNLNMITTINSSVTYFGAGQPTATITNNSLNYYIASALVAAINAATLPVTAAYTGSPDGTFTLTANVSGTPYTLSVSTNITQPNSAIVEITQVVVNQNYFVTINGNMYSFLTDATITNAEQIIQGAADQLGFVDQINVNTGLTGISAVDNDNGTFTVSAATGFYLAVSPDVMTSIVGIQIQPYVATDSVATTLANILNFTGPVWYALSCTDRTSGTVQAIAAWIQTQTLIFGTASQDANIINQQAGVDTTSIAAIFQNLGYTRSFVMYHQDADNIYPECAWFGATLTQTPGSETWAFKQLAGIPYSSLTTNQATNALNKNCNIYQYIAGVGCTRSGTMAVGEYIDIVRGIDWLSSTIQINVYGILVRLPKVPYTDAGITAIQAQVQMALQTGVDNNFIADNPPFVVTVPLAANVSSNDKANRILRNVNFTATLAGAIQMVNVVGTLQV